ncbi:MAG: hypothetical protein JO309_03470 [Pseudonocardiales bacterium]|nr:hypothetical protein [Pseudonocardiales bacterium]
MINIVAGPWAWTGYLPLAETVRHGGQGQRRLAESARAHGFIDGDVFEVVLDGLHDVIIASQIFHHFSE